MDLLIAAIFLIGSFACAIAGNLIASELYDRGPRLAQWIIKCAVRRLQRKDQSRYQEEWTSHLNDCQSKIGMVFHALGCLHAAVFLRRSRYAQQHRSNISRVAHSFAISTNHLLIRLNRNIWARLMMSVIFIQERRAFPKRREKFELTDGLLLSIGDQTRRVEAYVKLHAAIRKLVKFNRKGA